MQGLGWEHLVFFVFPEGSERITWKFLQGCQTGPLQLWVGTRTQAVMVNVCLGVGLGPSLLPCRWAVGSASVQKADRSFQADSTSIWDPPCELFHNSWDLTPLLAVCFCLAHGDVSLHHKWGVVGSSLQTYLQTLNGNCDNQQVSEPDRLILLQCFLDFQYVFNNEQATIFILTKYIPKTSLGRK